MVMDCHGLKYSRIAVELGLMVHGHDRCYQRLGYENTFAQSRQLEELTVVKIQFDISELVPCRSAPDGDLVNVPGTWVFSICQRPHCGRSQVLALVMSPNSTVRAFKA